jgi:uncharacterized membrane protein YidH (DUF202 family)
MPINITLHNSILTTRLSNQRTYAAFMSTGLALASISYAINKPIFTILGVIMIIIATAQYYRIERNLNNKIYADNTLFYIFPILLTGLIFLTFVLEYLKTNSKLF